MHIAVWRDARHHGWMRVVISQNVSLDMKNIIQISSSIIEWVTA